MKLIYFKNFNEYLDKYRHRFIYESFQKTIDIDNFKQNLINKFKSLNEIENYLKTIFQMDCQEYQRRYIDFEILLIPINEIKIFEYQQEIENIEKVKEEILKEGFIRPILVVKDDDKYYLRNGHHRLRVMRELGYKNIIAFNMKEINHNGGEILNFNDIFTQNN